MTNINEMRETIIIIVWKWQWLKLANGIDWW